MVALYGFFYQIAEIIAGAFAPEKETTPTRPTPDDSFSDAEDKGRIW